MAKKKIYRTVIQYEILSDTPYKNESLEEIAYETFQGSWSGNMSSTPVLNEELSGKKAVEATVAQGSDPEFFNMDKEGNELEEPEY